MQILQLKKLYDDKCGLAIAQGQIIITKGDIILPHPTKKIYPVLQLEIMYLFPNIPIYQAIDVRTLITRKASKPPSPSVRIGLQSPIRKPESVFMWFNIQHDKDNINDASKYYMTNDANGKLRPFLRHISNDAGWKCPPKRFSRCFPMIKQRLFIVPDTYMIHPYNDTPHIDNKRKLDIPLVNLDKREIWTAFNNYSPTIGQLKTISSQKIDWNASSRLTAVKSTKLSTP